MGVYSVLSIRRIIGVEMKMNNTITLVPCKGCGVEIDVLTGCNGLCYECAKKEKYDKMDRLCQITKNQCGCEYDGPQEV